MIVELCLAVIEYFDKTVMAGPFFVCWNLVIDQSFCVVAVADFLLNEFFFCQLLIVQ